MASNISQQVSLFNAALKLASDQIALDRRSKIMAELATVIRASLRAGEQDPAAIASAAIAKVGKRMS